MKTTSTHARRPSTPSALRLRVCLAVGLVAACHAAPPPTKLALPPTQVGAQRVEPYRLGPDDVLRVDVHGHPELSTPLTSNFVGARVGPDGKLSVALIGAVPVEGLTLDEARAQLTESFAEYLHEPRLDLSLVEYGARRFYLYGEVRESGAFVLDRPLNVYQALTLGKGFTPRADRSQVVLLRETADGAEAHLIDGMELESEGLLAIRANDFLFVRRTGAGRFSEEVQPYLTGLSSVFTSVGTLLLVGDELDD